MATQRNPAKTAKIVVSAAKTAGIAPRKETKKSTAERGIDVRAIRQSMGLTRKVFSRLSQFSERAIADWEAGEKLSGQSRQRMVELERLQQALATVVDPQYIGEWLQTPNDAFNGLKPLEVVERGQIDRIWRMVYVLESGVPG